MIEESTDRHTVPTDVKQTTLLMDGQADRQMKEQTY